MKQTKQKQMNQTQPQLRPFEIMRHPACQRLSQALHSTKHAIVCGPSGSGVSMFVNAHADIFWTKSGTRMCDVLKIILDDDNTTSTELFQTYPGILENSYKGIIVDLPGTWSRNVVRFFFHKIQVPVVVVCTEPVKDMPYIYIDSTDPNETFRFLNENRTFFPFFPHDKPEVYLSDFMRLDGVLSQLMSKYRNGLFAMDEPGMNPYDVQSVDEAKRLVTNGQFEDVCSIGDMAWRAYALEVCSFTDCFPTTSMPYRTEDLKDISDTLKASVWFAGVQRFYSS
jgi:hypothetical protein